MHECASNISDATTACCWTKMSSTGSPCRCHCHWVFTQAPSFQHLSALSKGKKKKGDKPLMRAPLISLGHLCSTSFLPAIILLLLRSCQRFRGLRLSALVPHSTRLCLLALSSLHLTLCDGRRHHPKSSLSQAATIPSLCGRQWIRNGFLCSKWSHLWALKFHSSPWTANSGGKVWWGASTRLPYIDMPSPLNALICCTFIY